MDIAHDTSPKTFARTSELRLLEGGRPVFTTGGIPLVVACSC